jgi:hypothetical protein
MAKRARLIASFYASNIQFPIGTRTILRQYVESIEFAEEPCGAIPAITGVSSIEQIMGPHADTVLVSGK